LDELWGAGFTLTGHGINQALEFKYSDAQKSRIVQKISDICNDLSSATGVEWFVTSGTLLGLVRDGGFIKHDDDIDVAYISTGSSEQEIIAERRRIHSVLNSMTCVSAKDCAGGHFWVSYDDGQLRFLFDLFTAWSQDGYLNEYPLQPMKLGINSVLPTGRRSMYGAEVRAPAIPEDFLEHNYGPNWRTPDPSFRFDFTEHWKFYKFLTNAKIAD
jgi:hypothetical protein